LKWEIFGQGHADLEKTVSGKDKFTAIGKPVISKVSGAPTTFVAQRPGALCSPRWGGTNGNRVLLTDGHRAVSLTPEKRQRRPGTIGVRGRKSNGAQGATTK